MSTSVVNTLLNTQLSSFATANSLTVAWENKNFKPSHGATYLRPHLMLAKPVSAGLGSAAPDIQRGVFQVDIMAPDDKGWGDSYALADLLRASFARGKRMEGTGVSLVCEAVAIGPGLADDTRYKLPVSITFYAYMNPA